MTTAKITRIVKDRGFGFATDEGAQQYFFHYSAIDPKSKVKFESLKDGMIVEFEAQDAELGPRAVPRTLTIVNGNGGSNESK